MKTLERGPWQQTTEAADTSHFNCISNCKAINERKKEGASGQREKRLEQPCGNISSSPQWEQVIYGSCIEHQILATELPGTFQAAIKLHSLDFPLAYSFISPIFLLVATNKDEGGRKPTDQVGDLAIKSLGQILCFAQYWDMRISKY